MADATCGVLVVEDDRDIRGLLADVLTEEGYGVRDAANGHEALQALAEWRPCLILFDLMMPVMDGIAFLARQRADPELARIPVVVVTARGNLLRDAPLQAAAVLPKPFAIDELLETVDDLCPRAHGA